VIQGGQRGCGRVGVNRKYIAHRQHYAQHQPLARTGLRSKGAGEGAGASERVWIFNSVFILIHL